MSVSAGSGDLTTSINKLPTGDTPLSYPGESRGDESQECCDMLGVSAGGLHVMTAIVNVNTDSGQRD